MAHLSFNRVQIAGPWPALARLLQFQSQNFRALGPYSEPREEGWELDDQLGTIVTLCGSSRHAPPLASFESLSQLFPSCLFLISHAEASGRFEGRHLVASGRSVWQDANRPDTLAALLERSRSDAEWDESAVYVFLKNQAPALSTMARALPELSELLDNNAQSALLLHETFMALLSDESDRARQALERACSLEASLAGLSFEQACALFDAPFFSACPSTPGSPEALASAVDFAPTSPFLTPLGWRSAGAFLEAFAAADNDSAAMISAKAKLTDRLGRFLTSRAPESDRQALCDRLAGSESARRLLTPQLIRRCLFPATHTSSTSYAQGLAGVSESLLKTRQLSSVDLLEAIHERLAHPPAPTEAHQRALSTLADALDPPERLTLINHPGLSFFPTLQSALERHALALAAPRSANAGSSERPNPRL